MNKKTVKKRIWERYESNQPLNITAVKRECPELLEFAFRVTPFWGWHQAVSDAGVDYQEIRVELLEYLVCEICGKEYKNLANHLRMKHEIIFDDYQTDYPDAQTMSELLIAKRFVRARESNPLISHWEPLWTDEYALDRLAELGHRGVSLHVSSIEEYECGLYLQLCRRFGSYEAALGRIGLKPKDIRLIPCTKEWSEERIVEILRQLQTAGEDLAPSRVESSLYRAATRVFKGYDKALTAAGMDPSKLYKVGAVCSMPKKKAFLAKIKLFSKRKRSVYADAMTTFKAAHSKEIIRWYKSCWGNACDDAGVEKTHPMRKAGRKYPHRESVISGIKKRQKKGLPLNCKELISGQQPDSMLYYRGMEYFGDWDAALRAASGI